jgi:apolipoprotein N-acyltransferase
MALAWIRAELLLFFLIGAQAAGVMFLITKRARYGLFLLTSMFPFYIGWFIHQSENEPEYLKTISHVQPPARAITHPLEQAEEINIRILKTIQTKPQTTCVLMPESSFTHCLNAFPEASELWGINALSQGCILCIGSYRSDTQNEYNVLYRQKLCRITNHYDKHFLMPFVEKIPNFCRKISWIRNLFLKINKEFSPKKDSSQLFYLTSSLSAYPRICSDIYMAEQSFNTYPQDNHPILFAVNDSWFSMQYAQHLMFLYAILYAMQNHKDVLYVGHRFGCWISRVTGKAILF